MFLGVDGGGTKTAFCLLRSDGAVVASAFGPATSAYGDRPDQLATVLQDGISTICAMAGIATGDIDFAFFGLPGYGEVRSAVAVLDRIPATVLGHERYACDNDMVCGWAGSLGTDDGINVISGTGSMAFGVSRGRRARAGGWGELFGDEGSAHWIAIRGLAAFSRMSDGRTARGVLYELMRRHLQLVDDSDVIDVVVNRWGGRRSEVAALSSLVVEAAAQGDHCAAGIVLAAAVELADVLEACRHHLGIEPDETVAVSYSGGVFGSAVLSAFTQEVQQRGHFDLRRPLHSPVVGAALHAAVLAGTPLASPSKALLRTAPSPMSGGSAGPTGG